MCNKVVLKNTFIAASIYMQPQRSPPLPPSTFKQIKCTHITHSSCCWLCNFNTHVAVYVHLPTPTQYFKPFIHSPVATHLAVCSTSSKHSGGKGSQCHVTHYTAEVKGEHGLPAWSKEREYCKREGGSLCVLCMPRGKNRIGMLIYVRTFVYNMRTG